MPDTTPNPKVLANPKAILNIGDQVTARVDTGIEITIHCAGDHYHVTMLDYWRRPMRDGRRFPGWDHDQERAAREYAAQLYRQICAPTDPVTWIVYRAKTKKHYTTHHNQPEPEPVQLQLI